jgi:ABC-type transporter Mla MlaB component
MLRITEEKLSDDLIHLRLEGRLVGAWVALLQTSCEQFMQNNYNLTLNLSEVTFADQAGAALLARLQQQQVTLDHCSPFLHEQLKQAHTAATDKLKAATDECRA